MTPTEIIFEVREDEVDGGYNARALGHDVFTQGDTLAELDLMVKDAVACHFGGPSARRPVIHCKPMPHGEHQAGGPEV
ncbi:MAG: 2-oxoisovalerate dehydrogenase [Verrucomicrobia bacterium]|nr:2-oxoisovalerate dehydrogenase [Verrucomicrobiota bacterium]